MPEYRALPPTIHRPRPRATLTGISSRAWEHPADQGALVALRRLKGFDTVLKAMSGLVNERAVRLVFLGSAVRVDERQFPALHFAAERRRGVLDAERGPGDVRRRQPGPQRGHASA